EQVAQVPVEQHPPDVEHDGLGRPFSQCAEWVAGGSGRSENGWIRESERSALKCVSTESAEDGRSQPGMDRSADRSALAGLEAAIGLVDHIDPAAAADHAVVAVAALERLEAVDDLH